MTKFRLVAIDLDGTLLGDDFEISPRAKEDIRRVREHGVHVTLCTGRMFLSALRYARDLELDLPLCTYQGALVKTSSSGEVLYRRNVPAELAREVVKMANNCGYPVNVYYDEGLYSERLSPEGEEYIRRAGIPFTLVHNMQDFIQSDPIKLLVLAAEAQLNEFEARWRQRHGDALYVTKSMPIYLEFLHPEATKGRGLEAVAAYLGIGREAIMAIGDSWNDLAMFNYAGFKVVMGNARDEIKHVADYVTRRNDDDGVAEALEKFILNDGSTA